jgi:hypothetical protein
MVRSFGIGSVLVGLTAAGLAWGQSAVAPASAPADATGQVVTVAEAGKPGLKCKVLKEWTQPEGGKAYQIQSLDTGEIMTLVQSGPAASQVGVSSGQHSRTMTTKIFHWRNNVPPREAPMPPLEAEAPARLAPVPTIQSVQAPKIEAPAAPIIQTQASSVKVETPPPPLVNDAPATTPATATATAPPPRVWPPAHGTAPSPLTSPPAGGAEHAAGPMTPGGIVLTPAGPPGSIHEYPSSGSYVGSGESCKPSLLDRMKERLHHEEVCTTPCAPASTTTPALPPSPAAAAATTAAQPGDWRQSWGQVHGQRSEPPSVMAESTMKPETPQADSRKPDPLKEPEAYSNLPPIDGGKGKAANSMPAVQAASNVPPTDAGKDKAADLAPAMHAEAATAKDATQPQLPPLSAQSGTPLGAGSVMQAGDPKYLPVPVVTLPDMHHMPQPPNPTIPQAPQPNQPLMANAFAGQAGGMAPPMPPLETTGNAFSPPSAAAAEMASSAFHQGQPNAAGYGAAYQQTGYGPMGAGMYAPGYGAMAGRMVPPVPYNGPAQPMGQPGMYGPPMGQGVAPAGYYGPMPQYPPQYPQFQQPSSGQTPQNWSSHVDTPELLNMLRNSMLPSHREWAADRLAALDCRENSPVVEALAQAAREDPAATVRAGCVRCLAKMNANTDSVMAALGTLKTDSDPRVQHEVELALARFGHGQPRLMDSGIQQTGAILPAGRQ